MAIIKTFFQIIKIYFVLILVGGVFIFVGSILVFSSRIDEKVYDSRVLTYKVDDGYYEDDEGSDMYSPTFYYEVNGVNYECSSSFSSSTEVDEGQYYVYYSSSNPSKCITKWHEKNGNGGLFFMIFGCIPLIFIIPSFIRIFSHLNTKSKILDNGVILKNLKYELKLTNTYINNVRVCYPVVMTKVNGLEQVFIGKVRVYEETPEEERYIDVMYDPTDLSKFIVDFNINKEKL